MKKILMGLLFALLLAPATDARRKTAKAGEVENGVFTDAQYNYSMTLSDKWDVRIRKDKEDFRLTMVQRNYGIPTQYMDAQDYTYAPRIVLYAGVSTLSPSALIDSLLSNSYKSEQKTEMLKEFDFLREPDIVPKGRKPLSLEGMSGTQWQGEAKYMKAVQTSASSVGGKRVNSSYNGGLVVLKKNGADNVLVFHVMSEVEFWPPVFDEALGMINSITWGNIES
jgi:hypothetical protein